MKQYAFGADIGGTTVKIGLFETKGTLMEVWEIPTRKEENGKYILSDIVEEIRRKMREREILQSSVEGIGMGVPGPVSTDGIVLKCVNLGWGIVHVEQEMTRLTGLKVKAGNDANVAALGEMWQGGGSGYKNIVMVTLGTGVGGGIILNGRILAGADGAAGEIGHISMRDDEEECRGCGKKGCLEQYASASGIVRMTERYLEQNPQISSTLRAMKNFTSKEIFEEAGKGDTAAGNMADEAGKMLGKALAAVACVVNPEAFVIGGGMSKAGEFLLDMIRKYYKKYAFHAAGNTAFKLAALGNNAGIFGAVKLVLESEK